MARGTALIALPEPYQDAVLATTLEPHQDMTEAGEDRGTWESYSPVGTLKEPLADAIAKASAIVTPDGDWVNRATWAGPRPDFEAIAQAALSCLSPDQIAVITYTT